MRPCTFEVRIYMRKNVFLKLTPPETFDSTMTVEGNEILYNQHIMSIKEYLVSSVGCWIM